MSWVPTPHRACRLACAALALVSASTGNAYARTSAEAATARPGEIIITARRRDELLEKAAAPVSVVSGETLLERGTTQTEQLNELFPALTVQPTATGNLIFVRGVGNFTLQPNSDPAVGFAYDGIFISRPMGTLSQFYDVDRIELLKGPQGVLYGRNASAGSINVEPRQPVLRDTSARASISLASYDHLQSEAAINMPVGNSAAIRLAGAIASQENFLDGYPDGPEQQSVRAQVKALLGSWLTVRVSADYNHLGGIGIGTSYLGNYVFVLAEGSYRFIDSALPLSSGIYSPEGQAFRQTIFLTAAGRKLDAIGSRPRQDNEFWGAHAHITADLGPAQLTVIPALRDSSINAIVSGSPFGYLQADDYEQSSVEARLTGRNGPLEWLGGVFLFDEETNSDTTTNLSSSLLRLKQQYKTFSAALFGNATFHASDRLRLGGGLRVTRDQKSYTSEGETLAIVCLRLVNNRPSCPGTPLFPLVAAFDHVPFPVPAQAGSTLPILVNGGSTGAIVRRSESTASGRLVDQAVTWRVGAEADLSAKSLLYASIETGFRPGGFNSAVGFETYEPERITAYTIGLRHRGQAGRLDLDIEAFWWDYRDQQVSALRPDLSTPPRNANITDNVGSSRILGIEGEVRYRPWSGAGAGAVVQYLDTDYRSFEYVYANIGVPPLTGCDVAMNGATNLYLVDCAEKQPYNSPRWSLNLNGRQTFSIGRLKLTAAADTHFRSSRNIGFAFLPEQRIGPSWTSNAQLILAPPGDRLEVAAFVRNIEGDRIPQFMIYHPVSNALIAGTNPPRQWGLRTLFRF